jgi:uncharacterized protein
METVQFLHMPDGGHYFFIKIDGESTIITSQRYKTLSGANKGIAWVFVNREKPCCYRLYRDSDRVFYFVIKGRNGRVLGKSEMYSSEEGAKRGMNAFMQPERVAPTKRRPIRGV